MARRDITQIQLASKVDMSQPAFSRRLNGEAEWSVADVYCLAAAMDCPITSLLPLPEVAA